MTSRILVSLPLRTVSEANVRSHFHARARRVKAQRNAVALVLRVPVSTVRLTPPLTVHLTRVAPSSGLDDDNLRSALKACRDSVADVLGIDDGDPRVLWGYGQSRSKARGAYFVEIEISEAGNG